MRNRCVAPAAFALPLLAAAGCWWPDDDDTAPSAPPSTSPVISTSSTGVGSGTGAGGADVGQAATSGVGASDVGSGGGPQCYFDEDCAYLDVDGDPCTRAVCPYGVCEEELVYGTAECQCHVPDDCMYYQQACNTVSCGDDHQCTAEILPAGPAPAAFQLTGDCSTAICDGVHDNWVDAVVDEADLPDDGNDCTLDACTTTGPTNDNVADGTTCAAGFCFGGDCMGCVPQAPDACGDEGTDEPTNDVGTTATPYARGDSVCGFLDSSDVDWFEYWADDGSWSYDILWFYVWSSAPEIQLCAYVACWNGGAPLGGCADKLPGPNGSEGCCWTGPPQTLTPSWDLYCSDTSEDSGTVYIAVSAPMGGACETYALYSHY